ncbi:MAG TPA: hypothetical protein VGB26_13020 [Nitrospiria bacterium]
MISMVVTESDSTINKMRVTQSHYIAETGIERALRYLLKREDGTCLTCTCASINGHPSFTNVPVGAGIFTVISQLNYSSPATAVTAPINGTTNTIPVGSTAGFANYGRVMVDREMLDCLDLGVNPLNGCLRGVDQTSPVSHVSGTRVGHNQCTLTSTGDVSAVSPKVAQRVIQVTVTIQEGWAVGRAGGGLTQDDFNDVNCLSSTNCWAVGKKNAGIFHWDGFTWHNSDSHGISPTAEDLSSVFMVSTTEGFAVGKKGEIYHYDGLSWHSNHHATSGTVHDLNGVSCVIDAGNTHCWAGGKKNAGILHWDNISGWHNNDAHSFATTSDDLFSISMISINSGYAVGKKGVIYHYDGAWHTDHHANSGTNQDLNGISCFNSAGTDYCWAVGNKNAGILHWDNVSWHNNDSHGLLTTPEDMGSISMISTNLGWAVGKNGTLYHYGGGIWHTGDFHSTSPTGEDLNGIHCVDVNNCWGVGKNGTLIRWDGASWSLYGGANATMLRWDGTSWSDFSGTLPAGVDEIMSISMLSYADGWAVGNRSNGNLNILRWNGSNWNVSSGLPGPAVNEDLESVYPVSSSDVWAVGNRNAGIFHWNGLSWHSNDTHSLGASAEDLLSVFMVSQTSGWAVGINGKIYHYDGTWHDTHHAASPTGEDLNSVHCLDSNNCWAVGRNGVILRYSAPSWVLELFPPTGQELNKVSCSSSVFCWAVGNRAGGNVTIIQWDGFNWVVSPGLPSPPVNEDLESVYGFSANDGWAAGKNGTLLHWDGLNWSQDVQSSVVTTSQLNGNSLVGAFHPVTDWREVY